MRRHTLAVVLTAALLVLAGCGGATTGTGADEPTDGTDGEAGGADGGTDTGGTAGGGTGTVEFYVSDQPTAIGEFQHLNVTITKIGFARADADRGEDTDDQSSNDTTATPATATPTPTPTGNDTDAGADGDDADADEDDESDERAGWVTRDVDSRTVDLTRLQGDNATLVGTPEIPAGEYATVFVHVESVDATLQDGTAANVKLPSGRLKLTRGFTLEPNGTVAFVYDISVVKAGNSGKYILKPVISQSGPGQPIEDVDDRDDQSEEDDENEDEEDDDTDDGDAAGGGDGGNGGDGGPPEDSPGNS